jgi:hypothetical protein
MSRKDGTKGRARAIQRATALVYSTCLRLARGELVLTPVAPDCIVAAALAGWVPPLSVPLAFRPCKCPRCEP